MYIPKKQLKVVTNHLDERLDIFLARELAESRSQIQHKIKQGQIQVNGKQPKKTGDIIHAGDTINFQEQTLKKKETEKYTHTIVPLNKIKIIAETSDYLVVYKPANVLTHPTEAQEPKTLVSWLLIHYPNIAGVGERIERPGIVHRLDKHASGALVVAKNEQMFQYLKQQFKTRTIQKEYIVLVYGTIKADTEIIDFNIDRGKDGRMASRPKISHISAKKIATIQPGKTALTHFTVKKRYPRYTLLHVQIHSGRQHQIRVHMFAYGHPIVGDTLYKNSKVIKKNDVLLDCLFLHAEKICFQDLTQTKQCFSSPLPKKLKLFLDALTR